MTVPGPHSVAPTDREHMPPRLRPPPELPDRDQGPALLIGALPMLGGVGSLLLVGSLGGGNGRHLLAGAVFVLASVAFVGLQLERQHRRRMRLLSTSRAGYLAHLAQVRGVLRSLAAARRRTADQAWPPPRLLPAVAEEGSRIWPRRPGAPGSGPVRIGTAPGEIGEALVAPDSPDPGRVDPACAAALHALLHAHRRLPDLPMTLDLADVPSLALTGPRSTARAIGRAVVCSAVAAYSPDHLAVTVETGTAAAPHWEWTRWLPHRIPPTAHPGGRHLLVVADGAEPARGPGRTVLEVGVATSDGPRVRPVGEPAAHGFPARLTGLDPTPRAITADRCDPATAEALARRLARRRSGTGGLRVPDLATLLEQPGPPLTVPLGVDETGRPLRLDLRESALGGAGPHGLLVGATGSGKSELLRTLVVGLALAHDPADLNLVLVDFKGGATFAGLADLPHVSALITNLADELPLVDRMADALSGELVRRQEVLRAGGCGSIGEYAAWLRSHPDHPDGTAPLPTLLVVVDEFSELLAAQPDFADLFVTLGRLGRSLGVHLLLASQRLDEGRLRGLESHLSYRIGLRTFSEHESRAVLGVPDAHHLPATPGAGYLRTGPDRLVRFTAAYVSGPAPLPRTGRHAAPRLEFLADGPLDPEPGAEPERHSDQDRPSVLTEAVRRLAGRGRPARRIWLPPLDTSPSLQSLLAVHRPTGVVPLGVVDRPRQQRRDVLTVDLRRAGGHVTVVGGPRSGKSTVLRTLLAGLALTSSPRETQVLALDLAGGTLRGDGALPHLVARAERTDPALVHRILAELRRTIERRESGERGDTDGYGQLFLVVDGWPVLRSEYADVEDELTALAGRAPAVGVHLLVAASRWSDLRPSLRDQFGTRVELRLGDPLDSEVDRRAAATVPVDRPGRGLSPDGHHLLTAVPPDELTALARDRWPGEVAPRLRLLPDRISLSELPAPRGAAVRLGVAEPDLDPALWLPSQEPHLVVLGDPGSGRTATLRTVLREVGRDSDAQVLLVDPLRSLLGEVPDDRLLDHLTGPTRVAGGVRDLATHLEGRLPGPGVPPAALRDRSWWSGPEVYVVADDHDLLGAALDPLAPLLPHARDVGLHVVVARRTAGAARALYDPVLGGLRDLAMPGLLLSGSPDEGPLLAGVRATRLPAGRGTLVTRSRGTWLVQVAWSPPTT